MKLSSTFQIVNAKLTHLLELQQHILKKSTAVAKSLKTKKRKKKTLTLK